MDAGTGAANQNSHGDTAKTITPQILDLFCCAGGAGKGYSLAGFEVVGVDIDVQPNYPFPFIQADVLKLDPEFMAQFDAIHASPPCQAYSDLAQAQRQRGRMAPQILRRGLQPQIRHDCRVGTFHFLHLESPPSPVRAKKESSLGRRKRKFPCLLWVGPTLKKL